MRLLILSDIHANCSALEAVLRAAQSRGFDKVVLLGDIIDYGPRPNETVDCLRELEDRLLVGLWGNHEQAILMPDACSRGFSSPRGMQCAAYTETLLTPRTREFLLTLENGGWAEQVVEGQPCLFVHGSLEDFYWGRIESNVRQTGYSQYHLVCSGHTHLPHLFEQYTQADAPELRNRHKTRFLNPGSVGQPRNHNPLAQYALLDTKTEEILLGTVAYDVAYEQSIYSPQIPAFYWERLSRGI